MILSDKKAICMMQRTKIRKRGQITIPSKMRKNWNVREGSEVMIETRNDELIIHPVISDPIKEGFGLFGKETLDADELKIFVEKSRSMSG